MIEVYTERPHIIIDGQKQYVQQQQAVFMDLLLKERRVKLSTVGCDRVCVSQLRKLIRPHGYEILCDKQLGGYSLAKVKT